MSNVIV